jgi:oligopeptide transport system substrate-binding protein
MKTKKLLAMFLAAVLLLSLSAGCGKKGSGGNTVATDSSGSDDSENNGSSVSEETYTLNEYTEASPVNWSPHAWETNGDDYLRAYCETPLVDTTIADDGVNFEWVYEAATSITDVTAEYADKAKYNIEDGETGRVYKIELNPALCWEDGTPINSETYIYSMQQLLSSEMKNYRANAYCSGDAAIFNAESYYNNDLTGTPKYGDLVVGWDQTEPYAGDNSGDIKGQTLNEAYTLGSPVYFNIAQPCAFFGNTLSAYYDGGYADYYKDAEGNDLYAKYFANTEGYVELTDEMIAALTTIAANFGDTNPAAWREMAFCVTGTYEEIPWEDVGLYADGDYTLYYITESPVTMFYFLTAMTSNWIVYKDLYEAGKETKEGLVATDYATSAETYKSYGAYKLVSFEKDKQMVFAKNDKWYGYSDGKHEGQYQTTDIKCDIIADHNTALQLFNQGKLDTIDLVSDDMPTYRMSDYILKTPETYMFRYVFATNLDSLTALEAEAGDGSNKRILYYDDFRKALSLSIDRAVLCSQASAGFKPGYSLLNDLYYYDIENNTDSIYRKTDEAKQAVLELYGVTYGDGQKYATLDEAYNSITGYDLEEAKALFQSVYEQAIADGNYTDGQNIKITCMCSAASELTADDTKQQDLLNQFVAEATKGTGLEGKITFTFTCGSSTRYEDVALGKVEMIRGAWGGAAFYPFSVIRCYCSATYMGDLTAIHESNGWNPTTEKLEITYDLDGDGADETETRTFEAWSEAINDPAQYANDPKVCLGILSKLETAILKTYQCIPWGASTVCSLYSKQVKYATTEYNIMYAYGGVRLMTYNYTDADWDAYVASQGGKLSYE